ncbi:MAG: helicase C-terminal domain-containing protein, partial [Kiritimatiellia bacterium]
NDALGNNRILVAEAGTGTGKSLANLIPACIHAQRTGQPAIISTGTINLQEQYMGKDIPLVQQLGLECRAVLAKGKGNYLCMLRADEAEESGLIYTSLKDACGENTYDIGGWIKNTDTGDRSEAPAGVQQHWPDINANEDCTGAKCPRYEACFYQAAKRRLATAQIIVTNHHLLMADLAVRIGSGGEAAIFPEASALIVDECFEYRTRILLPDGSLKRIGKLVHEKYDGFVMSYNPDTNMLEPQKVIGWYQHRPAHQTIRIKIDGRGKAITCTVNHKIYTPGGLKRADELQPGDLVYMCPERDNRCKLAPAMGEIQRQVALGTLMADASVTSNGNGSKARLQLVQGAKQEGYLRYKLSIFNGLFAAEPSWSTTQFSPETGVWRVQSISSVEWQELKKLCYPNGKKSYTAEWLKQVDERGLAFCWMDNGCLQLRNGGSIGSATLHTEGFSCDDCKLMSDWLNNRWGFSTYLTTVGHYYLIKFSTSDTEKLSTLVAPYVHPSMDYKLLAHDRGKFRPLLPDSRALALSVVESVEPVELSRGMKDVYNLTVEGNHNYFANGVLVSNCHHLEDVARTALGVKVSRYRLPQLLGRIGKLYPDMAIQQHLKALRASHDCLFIDILADAVKRGEYTGATPMQAPWIKDAWTLAAACRDMAATLQEDAKYCDDEERGNKLATQLNGYGDDLADVITSEPTATNNVAHYDVDFTSANPQAALYLTPVDVSDILRQQLWQAYPAAVLTSATLAAGGSFGYLRQQLGIDNCMELQVASPFDYKRQALLYVPLHEAPDPADADYHERLAPLIEDILLRTDGRAFVLFCSYKGMNTVYKALSGRLRWTVLKQGDAPNQQLIERFRADKHSVLFGTASFWEGVDIQGESLSCIIIDKLPFPNVGDPLIKAQERAIKARGGNPFRDMMMPVAALKLTQGFGRLIRTKTDRGLVAILDRRIRTKPYGRYFWQSLPECTYIGSLENVELFLREAGDKPA